MKQLERPRKPLQFVCLTLPWRQLPDYPDIGSYKMNADNSPAFIGAADTGDDISNFGILIHEMFEAMWCWVKGVQEEDVSKFDKMWFEEQQRGLHPDNAEPGYDARCPYLEGHCLAVQVERYVLERFGMIWSRHEMNCDSIS